MVRRIPLLALLMLSVSASLAQVTAVPPLLNFQARLAKPDGTPLSDGTYSIKFSLYDAAIGGSQKWMETPNAVSVHDGVFAVLPGKTTALTDALFARRLWLEL